ncbi:response regulator [Pedobacter insulae]|uniref:Response regulator receiver domain-containing protein n=1 Tax=Pedobacter insulae TaxID=414048 RepID=A0A1I2Y6C2_9SPHI|nr:response regulator [Pedobacter insulae]SFH19891.1 Response regulator receiver domain-containing protein [Pedobacter insulae]
MKYRKVLIIDDAQIDRYMAEKMMKKYEFSNEIITVESAMDALELLESFKTNPEALPDLIFLDINMPQMNGFDFLDEYEKLPELIRKKCIIIMLSSSLHPEDRQRALQNPHVFTFLSKPINAEKLRELCEMTSTGSNNLM